jgi:uncharacterized protein (TIGR02246 family)
VKGSALDRLAIRELLETYADGVSTMDADRWASTWAPDAVWELPGSPQPTLVSGKERITATWTAAMAKYARVIFVVTPGLIEIDGSDARVRSFSSEVYIGRDGSIKRGNGRYDDRIALVADRWLFTHRKFTSLHHE